MKIFSCTALLLTICMAGFAQQRVGIGTTTPSELLTVKAAGKGISQESQDGNVKIGFYTINSAAYLQTHSNHPLNFSANDGVPLMTLLPNGNFGIGTITPAFKMDIGGRIRLQNQADGNSAGIWFNNPANTSTIGFMGVADATTFGMYGNPFGWGLSMNTNTGNIGIRTLTPSNKFQIGSLGSIGFNGNDFAIGNGTNAMVINQSNAFTQIASSTDIVLMPRNNAHGRVGINTITPGYPLDVSDEVVSPSLCYAFFARNGPCEENIGGTIRAIPTSIYASSRVLATEFNAYSDARIKNITGVSNTTSDLAILNALKITDYIMKDKVKYGDKTYKKVIAQEVEKVYPQVVAQQTDFIPNVYQVTSKIEKVDGGYCLRFIGEHHISATAKKLRLLIDGSNSMQQFAIVSIPSEHEVIIKADALNANKAFVYGEEVADFRTVDYEGLTTLNISATQELSKLVKQQQVMIDALIQEVKLLKEKSAIVKQ